MRRMPVRYALWSMLAIAPAFLLLTGFGSSKISLHEPLGPHTGLMTMLATAVALGSSMLIAPGIVDPRSSTPGWAFAGVAAAFAQIALTFVLDVDGPASVWTGAYVPGAFVCLNVLVLVLIHVWVASAGMGFSPAVGIATGGLYGAWACRIGGAQSFDAFVGASCVVVALAFIAAMVAALRPASTAPAPAPSDAP